MADELAARRHRRLKSRSLPALAALALLALGAGLVVGGLTAQSEAERAARDFGRAWARGDFGAMYAMLGEDARRRFSRRAFEASYDRARTFATATSLRVGDPGEERDGTVPLPVALPTRIFGVVRGNVSLKLRERALDWTPSMVFPGLREGDRLTRRTTAPRRAALRSIDGKTLAEGPGGARTSPIGPLAASVAGTVEPADDEVERRRLFARGFPADTPVGRSGLERIFDSRIAGRPGGVLLAGTRVLARSEPRAAAAVETTIDTRLQDAAVVALAGRFGGIAALDPRSGSIRALAGVAFSAPQPPGSTFKIVTTTAALEAGLVKLTDRFPVQSNAVIDGVELENANGELCGGTFEESFAHSCNSVFGPLGIKVGSKRLVQAAERFGWNEPATLAGARPSTLPDSGQIVTPLEVGSTAIGQFRVLATPLQLASVAQTVANRGVRVIPTAEVGARPRQVRVTSPQVAAQLERLMLAVVDRGTGTAAAVPGVRVAGKTGTAELEDTRGPDGETKESDPSNTDAWFTAYAPTGRPRIAVAVLLVRNGSGGATAAPAARVVLARALGK